MRFCVYVYACLFFFPVVWLLVYIIFLPPPSLLGQFYVAFASCKGTAVGLEQQSFFFWWGGLDRVVCIDWMDRFLLAGVLGV